MRLKPGERDLADLPKLLVASPDGAQVPLSQLARFRSVSGAMDIARENGRRVVSIGIFIRDRELNLADYSVRMAHDLSIETVYQDKSLAEKQPLWRNFFVGRQITNRFGFIDIKKEKEVANQILMDVIGFRGLGITVDSTIGNLSGGERQGIAIGRAMHYHADLIILDEPTAALGVAEVRKVIDFVRRIKNSGRACIYIEHNLAHVHEVADRLIVLDRGAIVSEILPKDMSVNELTEYLINLQHKN